MYDKTEKHGHITEHVSVLLYCIIISLDTSVLNLLLNECELEKGRIIFLL